MTVDFHSDRYGGRAVGPGRSGRLGPGRDPVLVAREARRLIQDGHWQRLPANSDPEKILTMLKARLPAALGLLPTAALYALGQQPPPGGCHWCAALVQRLPDLPELDRTPATLALLGQGCGRCRRRWEVDARVAELIAAALEQDRRAAADGTEGAMVALVPARAEDLALEVEGAEPADRLHLTLAYLGDADTWTPDARQQLLDRLDVVAVGAPVQARVFGAAHWNIDTDEPSWVLNVGGDTLEAVHMLVWDILREGMADVGIPQIPEQHAPWVSHVAVAYSADPALADQVGQRVGRDIRFDRLRVAFGGDLTDLPLGGAPADQVAASAVTPRALAAATPPAAPARRVPDPHYYTRRPWPPEDTP